MRRLACLVIPPWCFRPAMQDVDNGRKSAVVSLLAAMAGFGLIPIFLRYFTDYLDAWTVNGVRYSIGALFWLPFLLFLERDPVTPAEKGTGPFCATTNAARRCRPAGRSGKRRLSPLPLMPADASESPGKSGTAKQRGNERVQPADPGGRLRPGNVWLNAIVPSVVNVIGQAGFGDCPYYVPASTLGFILRLSFLFTILFGFVFLAEERLLGRKPAFWAGVAVSVLGVVLMFVNKLQGADDASWKVIPIIVGTALAWGGYSVSVRYYMASYSARQSFGVISIYTSAALVALMFLWGKPGLLAALAPKLWGLLMGSALIGIAFGHVLYYRGIHRLGPVVANGIMLITPFVTYLAAALVLREQLDLVELAGGILVVAGGACLVFAKGQVEEIL